MKEKPPTPYIESLKQFHVFYFLQMSLYICPVIRNVYPSNKSYYLVNIVHIHFYTKSITL